MPLCLEVELEARPRAAPATERARAGLDTTHTLLETAARGDQKAIDILGSSHTLRIDMQLARQAIAAAALCCTAAPAAAAAVETKAVLLVVADDLGAAGQA